MAEMKSHEAAKDMKKLKACPMKASEIIKGLRTCEIECDCTVCPLKDYDQATCEEYLVTQAVNRLEELNRRVEQLKIENAQLRAVITLSDPKFFKRKCRVCGCDWNHPCNNHDYWVEDDLCSVCASRMSEKSIV